MQLRINSRANSLYMRMHIQPFPSDCSTFTVGSVGSFMEYRGLTLEGVMDLIKFHMFGRQGNRNTEHMWKFIATLAGDVESIEKLPGFKLFATGAACKPKTVEVNSWVGGPLQVCIFEHRKEGEYGLSFEAIAKLFKALPDLEVMFHYPENRGFDTTYNKENIAEKLCPSSDDDDEEEEEEW